MAGNRETRVAAGLDLISGILVGDSLLTKFKEKMVLQTVFKTMFGNAGERIFVDKIPSYNESILPALELLWQSEVGRSANTRHPGVIKANLILPVQLRGDPNSHRLVGAAFQRFLESKQCNLFPDVPGLILFGYETRYEYDRLIAFSGLEAPVIQITIPVEFDMLLLRQQRPEFDFDGNLDAELFGWVETYIMSVRSDEPQELIEEGVLSVTGETND